MTNKNKNYQPKKGDEIDKRLSIYLSQNVVPVEF
jgi:hypothetical protein